MKFTQQHIQAFCKASHDRNPLHIDAEYAKRTQFGKPVVYGVAAVVYALGQWANGRSMDLHTLRATFKKPLFEDEEYALTIEEADGQVIAKFLRGSVDYAVISFTAELLATSTRYGNLLKPNFEPQIVPNDEPLTAAQRIVYAMNWEVWDELETVFGIHADSMPPHQLGTLLWASYHVGMALPGRQALFSELQVSFGPQALPSAHLELQLEPADFDDRFNRFVLRAAGDGVAELRIVAFQRPLPVDFPLSAMPRFADDAQPLAGKVVFISGATRGFGAAMARMCALAGAQLALNYRGDAAAATALLAELQAHGSEVAAWAADMTDPIAVAEMTTAIQARFGQLDLIVNNAAPPIRALQFLEQNNADLLHFVQQNLAITLETARQLLPLLAPDGQFLHISTKYLTEPVRGFAHYLTAKAAQETLVQALALEYRNPEFIVARLPRILTDQTNLPFDFDPPKHPGEVAQQLIQALPKRNPDDNHRPIHL